MTDAALLAELTAAAGADSLITDPARTAPMLRDHRALYRGLALAVLAPADVDGVSRLLACCNERHIGVVPQGGNTSYCGWRHARRLQQPGVGCRVTPEPYTRHRLR